MHYIVAGSGVQRDQIERTWEIDHTTAVGTYALSLR